MIRNLSNPLYCAFWQAQTAASILSAPYIQRNIRLIIDKVNKAGLNWPKESVIPNVAFTQNNQPRVELRYSFWLTEEKFFSIASPETIVLDADLDFQGEYIISLPGVRATCILYYTNTQKEEDKKLLSALGQLKEHTIYSSFCRLP